jgi:osmotically-inducible protein OsmY
MYQTHYDDFVSGRVVAALAANPDVCADCIKVHTANGLVRLEGTVDTLFQKAVAEEVALGIEGVSGVQNDIAISADIDISDRVLQRAVDDEFASAGMTTIGARVEGGTAVLIGSVKNVAEESRAIETAERVSGLRGVISNLHVGEEQGINDLNLAATVLKAISDNPDISPMNLQVRADEGFVVVSGEVPERKQIRLVTETVEGVPGVKEVDNRFSVRPLRARKS